MVERALAAGALPPGLGEEQIGRLWRVFRANVRAVRAYAAEPCLGPSRAVLFVTAENPERGRLGRALGWERLMNGQLAVRQLSGDHYSLLRGPGVEELASTLTQPPPASEA